MTDTQRAFRQGLFFYDMVATHLVCLAGSASIFNPTNPMRLKEKDYISLEGVTTPDGRHIIPYEIHQQAVMGNISIGTFSKSCCCMLANTAYESVKDFNDHSPVFEFFRHIRNASSHQNHFNFFPHEPLREASWRGLVIDHNQKGDSNPLYNTECFGSFLGPSDITDLLWDVEQLLIAKLSGDSD